METGSPPMRESRLGWFRIAILAASVIAAMIGSVLLATRDSGEKATTLGVTATFPLPGHPGPAIVGPDAVWVALSGDSRQPVGNRPLLLLDLATGAVAKTVYLGGQVSHLAHHLRRADGAPLSEDRLIASVQQVGSDGFGPTELVALEWRSGVVLLRRRFSEPVDQVVLRGDELWALKSRPGTLFQLDPGTLVPVSPPLGLSPGRTLGLASGGGYLWVTAADAGKVLRIDPVTRAIKRVHVGGFPLGIVVTGGSVWLADREGGKVVRLDPRTLRPIGESIRVGTKPSWLAVAGGVLFVTDQDDGTVARIDAHSGERLGLPIRIAPPARDTPAPMLVPAGRSVWVSSFVANTLTRITSTAGDDDRGGKVTVRIAGTNDGGYQVTDGGVVGTGTFTAAGAISDKGAVTGYRTVKGELITLRFVTVGKKGTITFVVTIDANVGTSRWTISSGTGAYKGLHGRGIERENFDYTVSTLTGTVSR